MIENQQLAMKDKANLTFPMFENILKELSLSAFKSNISKTEKVQAFL